MCCRGTQFIMLQMNLSQLKSIYMIAEECIRLNTTNYFQNVYIHEKNCRFALYTNFSMKLFVNYRI